VIHEKVLKDEVKLAYLQLEGFLRICGRIYVASVGGWVNKILEEDHCSKYSIHPGQTKMYHEHKKLGGSIQMMPILEWK